MSNNLSSRQNYQSVKRAINLLIGIVLSMVVAGSLAGTARSQGVQIHFGETKIENHYPKGMKFSVKIDVTDEVGAIYFHYRLGSGHWDWDYAKCSAKLIGTDVDFYSCIFFVDLTDTPPQLPITYKWQLLGSADRYSDELTTLYGDLQYEWKNLSRGNLFVLWHDRPIEFAEQTLVTAETAVGNLEPLFGVRLDEPIQIVVENSRLEYESWKSNPSPLVGGQAFPDLGTTIQIVDLNLTEFQLNYWLQEVVPHEISHLYFYKATGHGIANPPKWLDEGFAGFSEFGDHQLDWMLVRTAITENRLIPLTELRDVFEQDKEQLALSYAESFTAAEYLTTTYGTEAVKALFSAYREGKNNDEAFLSAFGRTQSKVEEEWETWVVERIDREAQWIQSIGLIGVLISCLFILSGLIILGIIIFFMIRNSTHKKPIPNS